MIPHPLPGLGRHEHVLCIFRIPLHIDMISWFRISWELRLILLPWTPAFWIIHSCYYNLKESRRKRDTKRTSGSQPDFPFCSKAAVAEEHCLFFPPHRKVCFYSREGSILCSDHSWAASGVKQLNPAQWDSPQDNFPSGSLLSLWMALPSEGYFCLHYWYDIIPTKPASCRALLKHLS